MYLSAEQLANLIGCRKNSFNCMKRWLDRNGWPYVVTISGFPKVSLAYHDARMIGEVRSQTAEIEPNFGALHGR